MISNTCKPQLFQKPSMPEARIKFLLAKSQYCDVKSNVHTNFKYCKRILTSYSVTRKSANNAMPYKIEEDDISASLILQGCSSKIPQDVTRNFPQNCLSLCRSNTKVNSPPKDYICKMPLSNNTGIAKMIDKINRSKKTNHWSNRIRKKYKAIITNKAIYMKNQSLQISHNNNSSVDLKDLSIDTLKEQEIKRKLQLACDNDRSRKNKIYKGSCIPKRQLNTIDVHTDNSPIEILQLLPVETASGFWKSPHENGAYKKRKIKKLCYHGHTLEIPHTQAKPNKMQDSGVQISDSKLSHYVITGHSTNYSTHGQDYKIENKGIIEVIVNPRRKGKYSLS